MTEYHSTKKKKRHRMFGISETLPKRKNKPKDCHNKSNSCQSMLLLLK